MRIVRRLAWAVFLFLDVVLVVLFGAGYLARYVHTGLFWWGELIAIVLPYLSIAVVLVTLLVAALRRWKLLAFHAVLLLLIAVRFWPGFLSGSRADASSTPLTILTFNAPDYWGGFDPDTRKARMAALVESVSPDLFAMQEAGTVFVPGRNGPRAQPYVRVLVDSLGYHSVRPSGRGVIRSNLPVFGRIPLSQAEVRDVRYSPQDPDLTEIMRVEFEWEGRSAVLYNIHLRSFGQDKPWNDQQRLIHNPSQWIPYLRRYKHSFLIRTWEGQRIREMIERESLPVIVTGDFNSTAHNYVYRQISESKKLRDAFKVAGRSWGGTYHSRIPFARIDFVLVSPEWDVVHAEVPVVELSDHRPLMVKLRWRE